MHNAYCKKTGLIHIQVLLNAAKNEFWSISK